MGDNSMGNMDA